MPKDEIEPILEAYVDSHTDDLPPLLIELAEETQALTDRMRWSIGKVEGRLLQMLVKMSRPRQVIEIGTFTGFSALLIAEALPRDGRLITCEADAKFAGIAERFFKKSPYGARIELRLGPAMTTLAGMPSQETDFVFIDADKPSYGRYYDESLRLLRAGGIIFVDNVFWRRKIFKARVTNENAKAIAAFNEKVNNDPRVEKVMLSVRDGVYLIRKK